MKIRQIALLSLTLLLAACGPSAADQQAAVDTQVALLMVTEPATGATTPAGVATDAQPAAPVATIDPLLPSLPADAACVPDNTPRVMATVTDVWSGDSIGVTINGTAYEVRYIGIDAGDLPMEANRQLVEGKEVMLITDTTDVDQYGRLPRYVIADGVFVNLALLRQDAAFLSIEDPDSACEQVFEGA